MMDDEPFHMATRDQVAVFARVLDRINGRWWSHGVNWEKLDMGMSQSCLAAQLMNSIHPSKRGWFSYLDRFERDWNASNSIRRGLDVHCDDQDSRWVHLNVLANWWKEERDKRLEAALQRLESLV